MGVSLRSNMQSVLNCFTGGSNSTTRTAGEQEQTGVNTHPPVNKKTLESQAKSQRERTLANVLRTSSTSQASKSQGNTLGKYLKADIKADSAAKRYFEEDAVNKNHENERRGFHLGVGLTWVRMHDADPSATAESRMDWLTSEGGIQPAIRSQKQYENDEAKLSASEVGDVGSTKATDSMVKPEVDLYGMHGKKVLKDNAKITFSEYHTKKDGEKLGKLLESGYYNLGIVLKPTSPRTGNGESSKMMIVHADTDSKKTITVFDPHLGELQAPKKELHSLLAAMSSHYKKTLGLEIREVDNVEKMEFKDNAYHETTFIKLMAKGAESLKIKEKIKEDAANEAAMRHLINTYTDSGNAVESQAEVALTTPVESQAEVTLTTPVKKVRFLLNQDKSSSLPEKPHGTNGILEKAPVLPVPKSSFL